MIEPVIKVKSLAYVRVSAPDVEQATAFLEDFGLQVAHRSAEAVYLRGTDAGVPCYVLTSGSAEVTTIAFEVESAADLEALAQSEGATIASLEEPLGGQVVRLRDPNGLAVEVVFGPTALPAIDAAPAHAFNMDGRRERQGSLPTVRPGPAHVRRIGHLVLESADPAARYAWYSNRFGLRKADEVHLHNGDAQMVFASLDRGREFVDHHVVGFQYALDEGVRVQHVAFEVGNLDDLMAGHHHLKAKGRKPVWGVGRHRFGGQIYDYWANPWGVIHEHWTDTDLVNDEHVPGEGQVAELEEYWGPQPSLAFLVARWNWKVVRNLAGILRARVRASRSHATT